MGGTFPAVFTVSVLWPVLSGGHRCQLRLLPPRIRTGAIYQPLPRLIGFICERPESADFDQSWSETGDRYLVSLFRDFMFHQLTEEGSPVTDWGHVIECLEKVDAGVPERIALVSRDEMSCLIVSYADVKRCIESSYQEVVSKGAGGKGAGAGGGSGPGRSGGVRLLQRSTVDRRRTSSLLRSRRGRLGRRGWSSGAFRWAL